MAITIRETSNYDQFELLDFNRDVSKTAALEKSMSTYGWIDAYPMHVVKNGSGKLKIKGGHHRFHVARKLGIPVKYVVTADMGESVHELERATRNWSVMDYVTSFARVGNEHYMKLLAFHEATGMPIMCCGSLVAGESASSGNQNAKIKDGTYKIGDQTHAIDVAKMVIGCDRLGVSFAKKTAFVAAASAVCRVSEFSIATYLKRVEKNLAMMINQPNRDAHLALIEQVYNYGSKTNRIPLAFLAREAMASRNAKNKWSSRKSG